MGQKNPAQRRKTRTNNKTSRKIRTQKLVKKAKPQELIESIVKNQQAWDTHKTTDQNYDNLGVRVRVNGSTGGSKSKISRNMDFTTDFSGTLNEVDGTQILGQNIQVGGWKVKPVTSSVVSLAEVERDEEGNITTIGILPADTQDNTEVVEETEFARVMKERAAEDSSKHRWASLGQMEFIKALHKKYGQDYVSMAKDKKLNINQLTPVQIRKLFQKVISSA